MNLKLSRPPAPYPHKYIKGEGLSREGGIPGASP